MVFPQPLDVWYPNFIFLYSICDIGGLLAQVVFGGGEDALIRISGMWGYDQCKTGDSDNADEPAPR